MGLYGTYAGEIIPINSKDFTIGRHRDNHLVLGEPSVSRQHATILLTRRGDYVRDENSKVGTFVNDYQVIGSVILKEGDIIRVGFSDQFEYRSGEEASG